MVGREADEAYLPPIAGSGEFVVNFHGLLDGHLFQPRRAVDEQGIDVVDLQRRKDLFDLACDGRAVDALQTAIGCTRIPKVYLARDEDVITNVAKALAQNLLAFRVGEAMGGVEIANAFVVGSLNQSNPIFSRQRTAVSCGQGGAAIPENGHFHSGSAQHARRQTGWCRRFGIGSGIRSRNVFWALVGAAIASAGRDSHRCSQYRARLQEFAPCHRIIFLQGHGRPSPHLCHLHSISDLLVGSTNAMADPAVAISTMGVSQPT